MVARKATDDQLLQAYAEHRGSTANIARALDMTPRAIASRLRKLKVPPLLPGMRANPHQEATTFLRRAHGRIDMQIDDGVILVGSDAHYFPGTVSTAHRAFVKLCAELKPRVIVQNGDVFDGATISRYPRIGWDDKPTVTQELKAVDDRLTEIQAVAGRAKLVWTMGNHDARFETYLAAHAPQFEGVKGVSLKDHFPAWLPCWGLWINDTLVIKHRWKGGIHATRNNTVHAGTSFVTGHLHSLRVTPFSDYNGTRFGCDTGTLADPYGAQFSDYTELNPVDWRSGFAVLTIRDGRLMWPEVVHVIEEGVVEFRGDIIRV